MYIQAQQLSGGCLAVVGQLYMNCLLVIRCSLCWLWGCWLVVGWFLVSCQLVVCWSAVGWFSVSCLSVVLQSSGTFWRIAWLSSGSHLVVVGQSSGGHQVFFCL